MHKKLWIVLAMVLVIPGLLLSASCAKKAVVSDKSKPAAMAAPAKEAPKVAEDPLAAAAAKAKAAFLNDHIYFDFDKYDLKPAEQETLRLKAKWLRDNPNAKTQIEGHCDERGTNQYNMALGDRRANACKKFLIDLGIDAKRLSTISYGEEKPVDKGKTEEAFAKNRRAAFVLP